MKRYIIHVRGQTECRYCGQPLNPGDIAYEMKTENGQLVEGPFCKKSHADFWARRLGMTPTCGARGNAEAGR